jgi:hypothetical protein
MAENMMNGAMDAGMMMGCMIAGALFALVVLALLIAQTVLLARILAAVRKPHEILPPKTSTSGIGATP